MHGRSSGIRRSWSVLCRFVCKIPGHALAVLAGSALGVWVMGCIGFVVFEDKESQYHLSIIPIWPRIRPLYYAIMFPFRLYTSGALLFLLSTMIGHAARESALSFHLLTFFFFFFFVMETIWRPNFPVLSFKQVISCRVH